MVFNHLIGVRFPVGPPLFHMLLLDKKSKYIKFFYLFLFFLIIDFTLTSLLFKKTTFWDKVNQNYFTKKHWRIESKIYHHDLSKNVNVIERWGNLKYNLTTNSLGFRDNKLDSINKTNNKKKRIYVNGDSFVEGVGYDYQHTVIGMLDDKFSTQYEILNSAVASYSPSIYYRKTKYFIDKGLKFDYCIIFLDISDIPDENFINENSSGYIYDIRQKKKKVSLKGKIYKIFRFYRDNFISGKILAIVREATGQYKSNLKKRYLAAKNLKISFFKISENEINFYKSLSIDRSSWTFNKKYSDKWKEKGLLKSSMYLKKLSDLLNDNKIKTFLVIYPNPGQIYLNKENVHEIYWKNWAKKNDIELINLYKYFEGDNKKKIIQEYFIPGDVHWNKKGHKLVYNVLKNELIEKLN